MKAPAAIAAAVAALCLAVPSAHGADECRGLMVCIPVAGPWVVLPASSPQEPHPARSWRLRCPPGSIVGGVDARLTERSLDLSFSGLLGSPVNPGVTTTNEVVFTAVQTARRSRPASFRPFIGCIPTAGGGRIPTAVRGPAAAKPGRPTVLRVATASVIAGAPGTAAQSCRRGERLVSWRHAVGLRLRRQPTVAELRTVRSQAAVAGGRVVARASLSDLAYGISARLQVLAVCARGPGQP